MSGCGVIPELSLMILHAVFTLLGEVAIKLWKYCLVASYLLLLLLTALQPLVGFGLLYDFIPPSPISTFLPPISHFHLP